jgi:hypothetical protein
LFDLYGIEEETPKHPQVHPFEQRGIAYEQQLIAKLATKDNSTSGSTSESSSMSLKQSLKPSLPPTVLSLYHLHLITLPLLPRKRLTITFLIGVVLEAIVSGKALVARGIRSQVTRSQHHTNGVYSVTKLKPRSQSLRA